ncbi:hypothetical protein [Arthrobacter sp. 260]|uniref:hypothetical protein n=1 Tax=Arthrobacter sp. 260 TaxID=2735314 RepID=UPI00149253DD|nr:hypothetical protein [Arthrobacter sp. 260]NOJ60761.1 hypothetical protein [Arthrobacter sp. 260]
MDARTPEEAAPRSAGRKVIAGVLTGGLVLALGIGYLVSSQAATPVAEGTPTPALSSPADSTASPTDPAPEGPTAPPPTDASSTAPAAGGAEPAKETAPANGGAEPTDEPAAPADVDPAEAEEPDTTDAELAAIEQPVSEPVTLEESSDVANGLTATVSSMEPIDAEAFGIGEIAGPALRFVITVENTTDEAVSLGNSVVNVEYGPDSLPAVQLTGSGATEFPATVDAGESAATTLVFSIPADERDSIRILLNVEASSPIAAFVGAAPVKEG